MASNSIIQTGPSSSSSSCSTQWKYEVFRSSRGETRNSFTDHLYHALTEKEIIIFKDDTELEWGNPISLEIFDAIKNSKIVVIILCKNYASSTWCLQDLAKIVECMEEGLRVLLIFYLVDPSHVRHQKKTFAKAFAKHEKDFKENLEQILQKWKAALRNVANLSGRSLDNRDYFDKIHNKFDASSFLEDVREASKDTRGLEKLQDQLLHDMKLKCNGDLWKKIQMISNGLRKKRVLIVVDDVSKKEQLETLVGKPDWFGPRSRIIITTEDKHLLVSYEVQVGFSEEEAKTVCNVKGLNNDDALQLFSLNAFLKPHCENYFWDLCKNFVNYAQGIPLVLKVLGSHLCTKSKKEWESTWNQLKVIPDEEITKKLQIAFDGLNTYERKLFLDIACFFKGEDRNRVDDILESVCYSHNNIRNLINKSSISIVGGKLWMHNLLQEMGWEIVRKESEEPEKRSRL